jgi:hypothetical protein
MSFTKQRLGKNFRVIPLFFVIALSLGLSVFATTAEAATVYWTGAGNGTAWASSSNWSSGSVPTATDDVVIDVRAFVSLSGSTTIQSLTLGSSTAATSSTLNFAYDAIGGSPLLVNGDVHIYNSAQMTHSTGTSAVVGRINLTATGSLTVYTGGAIDVSEKGFAGGYGTGTASYIVTSSAGGGGYGGYGGTASTDGGITYGSTTAPTDLGSNQTYHIGYYDHTGFYHCSGQDESNSNV